MNYFELLKDPRWQKKRLEVLERAEWKCVECGDETTTLHVHHTYYAKGRKPWEYEHTELRSLCAPCHTVATESIEELQRLVGAAPAWMVDVITGFVRGFVGDQETPIRVENPHVVSGLALLFQMPTDVVAGLVDARLEISPPVLWAAYSAHRSSHVGNG